MYRRKTPKRPHRYIRKTGQIAKALRASLRWSVRRKPPARIGVHAVDQKPDLTHIHVTQSRSTTGLPRETRLQVQRLPSQNVEEVSVWRAVLRRWLLARS